MGKKHNLIEGVSGAGKTTVATEREKRGSHVVHGDRDSKWVHRALTLAGLPGQLRLHAARRGTIVCRHQVFDDADVVA